MKNLTRSLLYVALLFTSLALVKCTDDGAGQAVDQGLYSVKNPKMEINNYGGSLNVTFLAMGNWEVFSDSDWCTFEVADGGFGDSAIKIKVAPNIDDATADGRTAKISINIQGYYNNVALCEVHQSDSVTEESKGLDANKWISDIMTENYLWYDEFIAIKPKLNYWADANSFFNSALSRMSNIDEDGKHYASGERYYYSALNTYMYSTSVNAPASRAEFATATGFGINMLYPVPVGKSYYLLVASVIDESPADRAGIRRGTYITKYDKSLITGESLETCYNTLLGYTSSTSSATLTLAEYEDLDNLSKYPTVIGEVTVSPAEYTNNPVIYKSAYQSKDETKTAGYLVYSAFDMSADEYLLTVFEEFKSKNVTDMIIDLRYNGGGDVYSSALMATALVGSKYKGQVYSQLDYNEYRKAKGEVDYFYIGEDPSMNEYKPIPAALGTALDLERVYLIVTGFTASASELIINGLRGMDVEVILIGDTTEGKNVGMEGFTSTTYSKDYDFGKYVYELLPITFYNRNAKGFCDFAGGFKTDFEHTETDYVMVDWSNQDHMDFCLFAAIKHIFDGEWPSKTAAVKASLPVDKYSELRPQALGSRVSRTLK